MPTADPMAPVAVMGLTEDDEGGDDDEDPLGGVAHGQRDGVHVVQR
eukprot:CAMPEP_0206392990 /NCGR_PEP_ID=MMETSP0294-20121207/20392_1 /ASSEMBLY_ACC=CAM_ASM_000327 /TAXON_ID=39354 /ORGANISM="Heterosigma akashiwo, Strain CCMP2393" /LENGTH=45 /DNA_ID= /DNA_START= /DNA_END= /DNA_ORIENTATION=